MHGSHCIYNKYIVRIYDDDDDDDDDNDDNNKNNNNITTIMPRNIYDIIVIIFHKRFLRAPADLYGSTLQVYNIVYYKMNINILEYLDLT